MPESLDTDATVEAAPAAESKRNPLRRVGCLLLLTLWFLLLLTPCGLFYLAANGEIRLDHADIPAPHSHPLLLVTLLSNADYRGLQITRSSIVSAIDGAAVCIETAVSYLLWSTSGGDQNVKYCDCYSRADAEAAWALTGTHSSACE